MKAYVLLTIASLGLVACDTRVNIPPAENNTTVVNPPAKEEKTTTIVNPPAQKTETTTETKTETK